MSVQLLRPGQRILTISGHGLTVTSGRATLTAGGGAPSYVAYCTFDDADATSLVAYSWANAGDVQPGAAQWSDVFLQGWAITSGRAYVPSPASASIAKLACGVADGTLSVIINLQASSSVDIRGLVFRYADTTNYWVAGLRYSANEWGIWQAVAGARTARAVQSYTVTPGVDYTIQVVLSGSDMTATLNGANVQTYSSATYATSTVHGLRIRYAGDKLDTFTAF